MTPSSPTAPVRLALALSGYRAALGSGAGRVAAEAARAVLLSAAADCGYDGDAPLLLWADERVRTALPKSGRELDTMFRRLPRVDLEALLMGDPYGPRAACDPGCLA